MSDAALHFCCRESDSLSEQTFPRRRHRLITPQRCRFVPKFNHRLAKAFTGETRTPFTFLYASRIDTTMKIVEHFRTLGIKLREGQVLVAGTQTEGVGSNPGSNWYSTPNDITCSVLLQDKKLPHVHRLLVQAAGSLAVISAIKELTAISEVPFPRMESKWPNDVRAIQDTPEGQIAKKFSGVYCVKGDEPEEKDLPYAVDGFFVCGVGINLDARTQHVENSPDVDVPVTSVGKETGKTFRREHVVGLFLHHFDRLMSLLEENNQDFYDEMYDYLALGDHNRVYATLQTPFGLSQKAAEVHGVTPDGFDMTIEGNRKVHSFESVRRLAPLHRTRSEEPSAA